MSLRIRVSTAVGVILRLNKRLNEVQVTALIYFPSVFLHELAGVSSQGRSTNGIIDKLKHRFGKTVFIPGLEKLRDGVIEVQPVDGRVGDDEWNL
jgi:hypothetical protein